MKRLKVSMMVEADDNAVEEVKESFLYNVDYLIDFDSWPEIKEIYGVEVEEV